MWGGLSTASDVDIEAIKPAAYNPRKIAKERQREPCEGIRRSGPIAPIPVNRKDSAIIAGHQRTKAARPAGTRTVPVQYVESVNLGGEIKFNQIHSATESGTARAGFDGDAGKGRSVELDNKDFTTIEDTATAVKGICGLTPRYGNVPSAVIRKGDVIPGGDYAKARKALGPKANACACDDSMHGDPLRYLGEGYGGHPYGHIERDAYVQGPARPHRSAGRDDGKRARRSAPYARHAIPYLREHASAKTAPGFGCGKGDCTGHLKKMGHGAPGVEFSDNDGRAAVGNAKQSRRGSFRCGVTSTPSTSTPRFRTARATSATET